MMGKARFEAAMSGRPVDCTAVVPKIWIDLAAKLMNRSYLDVLNDPALAAGVVIAAARQAGADAGRLFLFPRRHVVQRGEKYWHLADDGRSLGEIDIQGGWSTRLTDDRSFDLANPDHLAHYSFWHGSEQMVSDLDDVRRLAVPDAGYYEQAGYGAIVDATLAAAGDAIGCIGDCSSGTLAFQVALRGMSQAMLDLVDDEELTHAIMAKGIAFSLARARFFVNHGIRILRYNDSTANMSVISPALWREYILPHLQDFCAQAHKLSPDVRIYCHICGNILPIAADLAASGLDCIAPLDPLGGFSVSRIRDVIGPETVLMGGINTLSFMNADTAEITAEARRCIREGSRGGSFILGSGCVLPRQTRPENLLAVIQAAHQMSCCDQREDDAR